MSMFERVLQGLEEGGQGLWWKPPRKIGGRRETGDRNKNNKQRRINTGKDERNEKKKGRKREEES